MPYPPPVPPANRTNATVQADQHPSDHNLISDALTEILNHIAGLETTINNSKPQAYGGSTPGGTTGSGQQATIASVTVGDTGFYLVSYNVLLSSTAAITGALRFFVNGSFIFDYTVRESTGQTSVSINLLVSTPVPNAVIGINMINSGPAAVDTYADGTNHRLGAVRVVYP